MPQTQSADWLLFADALRRQSRQRQSSPANGIGSRAVSSAHQHDSESPQLNCVPQREHAMRRGAAVSNQFVTFKAKLIAAF
jgi:hypothetical protein